MAVKFFYGISGTFKTTTVNYIMTKTNSLLNSNQTCVAVKSMIKTWKELESGIFQGLIDYNDLNYALLHLCMLKHELDRKTSDTILVERGISDMFYFMLRNNPTLDIEDEVIFDAVKKEEDLCKDLGINKIILIQEDNNFIEKEILKDPVRKATFPDGLKQYLENQNDYINFTKKFNSSIQTIQIKNAQEYLDKLK